MTDKKFTDEEIIKALECCADTASAREMFFTYKGIPLRYLFAETLDLINRQKEEVERLEVYRKLNDELEDELAETYDKLETARAEAIKEFAERLCEGRVSNDPVRIAVQVEYNQIAKELTEGIRKE